MLASRVEVPGADSAAEASFESQKGLTHMSVSSSRRVGIALVVVGLAPLAWAQNSIVDPRSVAPYVPTPPIVVERMLQLAGVERTDTVYDLGSGDG